MHVQNRASLASFDVSPTKARSVQWQFYRGGLKRVLDLSLVLITLPLTLPMLGLLAVLIRWSERAPAFYAHERIGRNGRRFRCWKLRTMVLQADRVLERHLASDPVAAKEWEDRRKLAEDPRVTRLGRVLRCSSLDELPQLLNVVRGEMSLVGPRPLTPEEVRRYGADADLYCSVLPGITGLWQVEGRNGLRFRERIAFDVAYASAVSPDLDLKILWRTIWVVLARSGV